MTADIEKAKARLAALRAEIERFVALGEDAGAPVELDQVAVGRLSRMDAMQQQAMAQAAKRARKRDLVRIEMAERRIAAGEYGYCEDCGELIAEKRLQIDPMAERCVHCAR
ncbi:MULTISPECIES: TraR/DksA C4-type zinc finger protein [unclassified Roseitalea]|uniref:TraR/DksA family transcriptional regulator n=1 Tax=unclassified Roseitalea TaxID=2639107 RepID=UPI00273EB1BB|nr:MULTISPECIES: TraR/DksA C4-type zinc finger protein [unclassified Roseitalea]